MDNRLALFLSNPILIEKLMAKVQEKYENDVAPFQERLKRITGDESLLQKRKLRCYQLFEEDHIDGLELKRRLEGVTREAEKLKSEQIELERTISGFSKQTYPPEQVRQAVENIQAIIRNAAPPQKMALYRSLIQSITVPADRDLRQAVIHGSAGLFHLSIAPLANEGGKPPE
ncbi:hypothetical protein D3C73_1116910 [compost metagenome]